MPTGVYPRTDWHLRRLKIGHKKDKPRTQEHNQKIGKSVKIWWENRKKGVNICSKCGQVINK